MERFKIVDIQPGAHGKKQASNYLQRISLTTLKKNVSSVVLMLLSVNQTQLQYVIDYAS